MARRATGRGNRSRVWRAATVGVSVVATVGFGVAGSVVHAEQSPAAPEVAVPTLETETETEAATETGTVDGAVVAVGLPPVPETSVVVEVGQPPVPETAVVVAVGEPPVPETSVVVAVGEPPVPAVTVPDARPVVEPVVEPVAVPVMEPVVEPVATTVASAGPEVGELPEAVDLVLPETGADEARATAIVAGAAMSVGAALRALARR